MFTQYTSLQQQDAQGFGGPVEDTQRLAPAMEWWSAGELAAAIRARRVTSLEVVEHFIRRIEALDGSSWALYFRDGATE